MNDVTGGDLYSLWKIANVALPRVANVYGSSSSGLNGNQSDMSGLFAAGEGPHGSVIQSPIFSSFSQVYSEFQHILALSGRNIQETADAVNRAIEGYSERDTQAGEDLASILKGDEYKGTQMHDPDDPLTNPPEDTTDPVEPDYYDSPGDEAADDVNEEAQDVDDAKEDIEEMTE
ncbi:MAG TPA: hypothetical protein H9902_15085 [Candidatus Stackebrandtia faecavium]|nr:hypothetical protein [Candidatus Stackebrandtia faecavium]